MPQAEVRTCATSLMVPGSPCSKTRAGRADYGCAGTRLGAGERHRVRHEKTKFAKRTWNVPWNQQFHFLVRFHRPGRRGSHTSQKARCMRHPRLVLAARAHPTVGNEAGMCPGINRCTKCAPIADWVRMGVPLWCSRVGSGGAPVVGPGTTALRVRHGK